MKNMVLTALLFGIAMVGCTKKETKVELTAEQLVGEWQICIIDEDNADVEDMHSFMHFNANGTMGAFAGCNTMGGNYTYQNGVLTLVDGGQTEMYCEEMMEMENALFSFLNGIINVTAITTDSVILKQKKRRVVMRRTTNE